MKKLGMAYWITASALVVGGLAVMGIGSAVASKDGGEKKSFTETFEFADNISMDLDDCKLRFEVSDSAKNVTVEFINTKGDASAVMENNTLIIKNLQRDKIGFAGFRNTDSKNGTVVVTIPDTAISSLSLDGDALRESTIDGVETDSFDLDLDAAKVTIKNITVNSADSKFDMDAADVTIENSTFNGAVIDADAASYNFKYCTFTDKFTLNADAATIKAVGTVLKADMDIDADASKVEFDINGNKDNYSVSTSGDASSIKVDGNKGSYFNKGAEYDIDIKGDAAAINVTFTELK